MSVVLKIENVWKEYRLGVLGHGMLFRDMQSWWARLRGKEDPNSIIGHSGNGHESGDRIWALRDISLEVTEGQVLGIIGRNGEGKSTLLKLITRVTAPTKGSVKIRGRVASLLEVGTGFHPELTGRENVFLNGAILGMTMKEIKRKFDEIVDFSGVDRFVDTPVKRYSSGMYVRLAFAVAAHLESEILLIDEVLAVGDAEFQKKCLGKMEGLAGGGRAVLFVSHNLAAVERLCQRTIVLEKGGISGDGPSSTLIRDYSVSDQRIHSHREWTDLDTAPGDHVARLRGARIRTKDGETVSSVDIRQPVGIEMIFDVLESGHVLVPNYHLYNERGACMFVVSDQDPLWRHKPKPTGQYVSTAWIPPNFLAEGIVFVGTALSTMNPVHVYFYEQEAVSFRAIDPMDGSTARGDYVGAIPGVIMPLLHWENRYIPIESRSAVSSGT